MAIMTTENKDDVLTVGERLRLLMNESEIKSAPKLAKILYEEGLIEPMQREGNKIISDPELAITRRIQDHLKETNPDKIPTKYVIAYSKVFDCSTDYILGLTNIHSADMDTRIIAEKTGLSEMAVLRLLHGYGSSSKPVVGEMIKEFQINKTTDVKTEDINKMFNECWSLILESLLSMTITEDYILMKKALIEYVEKAVDLEAKELVLGKYDYDEITKAMQEITINDLKNRLVPRNRNNYYGIIYKMSTEITTFFDEYVRRFIISDEKIEQIKENRAHYYTTIFGQKELTKDYVE